MSTQRKLLLLVAAVVGMVAPSAANAAPPAPPPTATQLLTGLDGGSGSTVGPGGALYVTETAAGRISRVDPRTGEITTFASGLPRSIIGLGGTTDVAFIGGTAYALVTVVGPDVGGSDVVGIYRIDGPDSFTVVADIGAFALSHPPGFPIDVPTGLQYALETYRGGFLVTDGHHNRVYRVTRDGEVSQLIAFGNIVPTGLEVRGKKVYMAEAGPVPHDPADGKVVAFKPKSPTVSEVASGAPLLVDVEFGRGRDLYRPLAGQLRRRSSGFSGGAEHRQPREGERGRHVQHRRRRLGPADLGRVHQEHRVHRHAHRGDLEGRERFGSASRSRVQPIDIRQRSRHPGRRETAIRGRLRPEAELNPFPCKAAIPHAAGQGASSPLGS